MGCLKRLLWGVYGLAAASLAVLVLLYENQQVPHIHYFFSQVARCSYTSISMLILAAVVLFGACCMLLVACFAPCRKSRLIDRNEGGVITISRSALENNVRSSIDRIGNLSCEKVRVRIIQRRIPHLEVDVEISAVDAEQLQELAQELQEHIKLSLEHFSGYSVSKVRVNLFDKHESVNSNIDD